MRRTWGYLKQHLRPVQAVISLGLICWLLWFLDLDKVFAALAGSNIAYLGILAMVVNGDRLLMAYKWNLLLRARGIKFPLLSVVGAYYKASFAGKFLPSLGADAIRVALCSRGSGNSAIALSSVMAERAMGLVATAAVSLISALMLITHAMTDRWDIFWGFLAGLVVVLGLFFVSMWRIRAIVDGLCCSKSRILNKVGEIAVSYQSYSSNRETIIIFLLLSIAEQLMAVFIVFFTCHFMNIRIEWVYLYAVVPIASIASRLPISIDGFGVREVLMAHLLTFFSVPYEDAVLVSFISHFLVIILVLPPSFLFLNWGKPLRDLGPSGAVSNESIAPQ